MKWNTLWTLTAGGAALAMACSDDGRTPEVTDNLTGDRAEALRGPGRSGSDHPGDHGRANRCRPKPGHGNPPKGGWGPPGCAGSSGEAGSGGSGGTGASSCGGAAGGGAGGNGGAGDAGTGATAGEGGSPECAEMNYEFHTTIAGHEQLWLTPYSIQWAHFSGPCPGTPPYSTVRYGADFLSEGAFEWLSSCTAATEDVPATTPAQMQPTRVFWFDYVDMTVECVTEEGAELSTCQLLQLPTPENDFLAIIDVDHSGESSAAEYVIRLRSRRCNGGSDACSVVELLHNNEFDSTDSWVQEASYGSHRVLNGDGTAYFNTRERAELPPSPAGTFLRQELQQVVVFPEGLRDLTVSFDMLEQPGQSEYQGFAELFVEIDGVRLIERNPVPPSYVEFLAGTTREVSLVFAQRVSSPELVHVDNLSFQATVCR